MIKAGNVWHVDLRHNLGTSLYGGIKKRALVVLQQNPYYMIPRPFVVVPRTTKFWKNSPIIESYENEASCKSPGYFICGQLLRLQDEHFIEHLGDMTSERVGDILSGIEIYMSDNPPVRKSGRWRRGMLVKIKYAEESAIAVLCSDSYTFLWGEYVTLVVLRHVPHGYVEHEGVTSIDISINRRAESKYVVLYYTLASVDPYIVSMSQLYNNGTEIILDSHIVDEIQRQFVKMISVQFAKK